MEYAKDKNIELPIMVFFSKTKLKVFLIYGL